MQGLNITNYVKYFDAIMIIISDVANYSAVKSRVWTPDSVKSAKICQFNDRIMMMIITITLAITLNCLRLVVITTEEEHDDGYAIFVMI